GRASDAAVDSSSTGRRTRAAEVQAQDLPTRERMGLRCCMSDLLDLKRRWKWTKRTFTGTRRRQMVSEPAPVVRAPALKLMSALERAIATRSACAWNK